MSSAMLTNFNDRGLTTGICRSDSDIRPVSISETLFAREIKQRQILIL